MKTEQKEPHKFCETPEEKCTMNYCDDNGCQNRKRELVNPINLSDGIIGLNVENQTATLPTNGINERI